MRSQRAPSARRELTTSEGEMRNALAVGIVVSISLAAAQPPTLAQETTPLKVVSQHTASGFKFPETVVHDPTAKALYVSQFGSELKPAEKDGKGKISKVSLSGQIVEDQFLPAPGQTMDKPKGMWVEGDRLWATDIDALWVFDLKTKKGRKLGLPGAQFANDVAVMGTSVYVSDNRTDQLFKVEPADFLDTAAPKVTVVMNGKSVNPNGIYPSRDGTLLMVGFASAEQPRGIYAIDARGEVKVLAKDLGRLDGLYELDDRSLLVTDWNTGSLLRWSAKGGVETLAKDFKGPADFAVVPEANELLVVVPDLPKSELRLIRLSR
jgi:hypothetical protein